MSLTDTQSHTIFVLCPIKGVMGRVCCRAHAPIGDRIIGKVRPARNRPYHRGLQPNAVLHICKRQATGSEPYGSEPYGRTAANYHRTGLSCWRTYDRHGVNRVFLPFCTRYRPGFLESLLTNPTIPRIQPSQTTRSLRSYADDLFEQLQSDIMWLQASI